MGYDPTQELDNRAIRYRVRYSLVFEILTEDRYAKDTDGRQL